MVLVWVGIGTGISGQDCHAALVLDAIGAAGKLLGHAPRVVDAFHSENPELDEGSASSEPWSGSYWPDILGGIASHYRDHTTFGDQIRFALRYGIGGSRVKRDFRRVDTNLESLSEEEINRKLSPTEKYDLLLGNRNFDFTRAVLADIDFRSKYLKRTRMKDGADRSDEDQFDGINNNLHYSDVQDAYSRFDQQVLYRYWKKRGDSLSYWFGICDGWSPASIALPRPAKPVTVTGMLGHRITFYPDDLKALGSYLFARTNNDYMASMNYHFAGRPCAEGGSPSLDDSGYVRDFRCNDLDPGLWHLVLLNRIGIDRMGFVMDADNNKKINNHPIGAYQLRYFNPATGREGSIQESMVSIRQVRDGYSVRRNPNAAFLLGVRSRVSFRFYQWPEAARHRFYDSEADDEVREKTYVYDLEVDRNGKILGGEWGDRSNEDPEESVNYADQPDFIWMSPPGELPYSEESSYVREGVRLDPKNPSIFGNMIWSWNGSGPLPMDWIRAARKDAAWTPPIPGKLIRLAGEDSESVMPVEARDSILKPAQPLSTLVFYLFDRARVSSGH